jgi:hypothetical protein
MVVVCPRHPDKNELAVSQIIKNTIAASIPMRLNQFELKSMG